jgi:hypothetical protein
VNAQAGVAFLGVPRPPRAQWCGSAGGEEKTAACFGGTGGQGVVAPRPKGKLLEEPSGSLETSAAERAEELLRAVGEEEQSNRSSCSEAKETRYDSFLSSLSLEEA